MHAASILINHPVNEDVSVLAGRRMVRTHEQVVPLMVDILATFPTVSILANKAAHMVPLEEPLGIANILTPSGTVALDDGCLSATSALTEPSGGYPSVRGLDTPGFLSYTEFLDALGGAKSEIVCLNVCRGTGRMVWPRRDDFPATALTNVGHWCSSAQRILP
jgi:hypothetical protein